MQNISKLFSPARMLASVFLGLIMIGSLLLMIPGAYEGTELAYIDALFTATSAVCVTGLVVLDTGTFYTPLGQTIIMSLIFFGALGIMTMTTLVFILLGRKITIRDRLVIREALNQPSFLGLVPLLKAVVQISCIFILIGTILLSIRFIPQLGSARGIFFALFHSISAFGNAGFDLFGSYDSLTRFPGDYLVNSTILVLFIIGGLGFTVIIELFNLRSARHRFSLHARMTLIISFVLLIGGTVLVLLLEYNNPETIGIMTTGGKIFSALFTSATSRTAGFSVLETGSLGYSSLLVLMGLMFIGASPTSTGGGVKTTTFGVTLITLISMVRGRREPVVFLRRFPSYHVMKAVSIIFAAAALVFVSTFLLTIFESRDFLSLLFEAFSAFGTVGLSTGITPELGAPAKVILIVTMYAGRIGPVTLLVALARKQTKDDVLKYPEEPLLIG